MTENTLNTPMVVRKSLRRVRPYGVGLAACVFLLLGGVSLRADDVDAASKLYNGNALYNMKVYSAAMAEYRAFLAANPQHAKADEARYGLALCLYGVGKHNEAEPLFRELQKSPIIPDKQRIAVLLGECVRKLRGPAEADPIFAAATTLPGTNTYYRDMALAYLVDGRFSLEKWKEAAEAADKALDILPQGDLAVRTAYQGAYARYLLEEMDAAAAGFEALLISITNTPLEGQVAFLWGESLREGGKTEASEGAYLQAATKEKELSLRQEAFFRLGFVRFELGNYAKAIEAFNQCLAGNLSNRVDECRLYMGRSYLAQPNYGAAEHPLRQVSASNNVFAAEATLWLSRVYSRQNRQADALKVLVDAMPRFGGDPLLADLLFEQAGLQMSQKMFAEASGAYGRIEGERSTWPRMDEVLYLHALCYHRLVNYGASIQFCDRFLAAYPTNAAVDNVQFLKAENQYLSNPAAADPALLLYTTFRTTFPNHPDHGDTIDFRIGQIRHARGEWAEALKFLQPLSGKAPQPGTEKVFQELLFLIGDSNFRQEIWDVAVTNLDLYVKKTGAEFANTDTAYLELGLASVKRGQSAAAIPYLQQLTGRFPKSPHLALGLSELGRLYYESKQTGPALQTLQRVVTEFPDTPQRVQTEYYLGWIALDARNDKEAEPHFLLVTQRGPNDPLAADSFLQLGLMMLRAQRYNEAWGQLSALLGRFPEFAKIDEAKYSAGIALSRMHHWDPAMQQFNAVLEKHADSALADRAAYELAWVLRKINRNPDAVKQYELLVSRYPQSELAERARFEMAELTFDAKDFDAVVAQLKEAIANSVDKEVKDRAMYRLGWAYMSKGDPEAAAEAFEAMLAEFPRSERAATAHYQAGEMRVSLKDYVLARDHFAAVLTSSPAPDVRESGMIRLGEMQALTGKWGEAFGTYHNFQSQYPESKWIQEARFGAGWAREHLNQYDHAIQEYNKVIAVRAADEISARAQFQIGECRFALKQYDAAMQELVRVDVNYTFPSWSGKALFEVGRALEAMGDPVRAIDQYKSVIARFPKEDVGAAARTRMFEVQASMQAAPAP